MESYVAEKQKVQVSESLHIAPRWRGQLGVLLRWVREDWYIVDVLGTELVLTIGEFTVVK